MATAVESLLTLKNWREDEAKNIFAIALRDLAIEEEQLRNLEDALYSVEEGFGRFKETDADIEDIKRALEYQASVIRQIALQRDRISQKEEVVEKARLELVEATRDKRLFERLLEKQKEAETKRQLRLEQKQSDESASVRFAYGGEE